MNRCSTCSGAIVRAFEGAICLMCGRPPGRLVSVSVADHEECPGCGGVLPREKRAGAHYCTDNCRLRAWRRKRRAAA